jgi:hypothetical protein
MDGWRHFIMKVSSRTFSEDDKRTRSTTHRQLTHPRLAPAENLNQSFFGASSQAPVLQRAACACGGCCPHCRAAAGQVKVSQPTDTSEVEADQIADRVMRMPNESLELEQVQSEPSRPHQGRIERKAMPSGDSASSHLPRHIEKALVSGGQPLNQESRRFFEPRFGYDLSTVRVFANSAASQSASAVNARAYTLGTDIVFGDGQYHPNDESGKRLLAHELAHTVQKHSNLNRQMDEMDAGAAPSQDSGGPSNDGDPADVQIPTAPPSSTEAGLNMGAAPTPMGGGSGTTAEITLETGNTGAGPLNNLVHQQVCVDRPSRSKRCFSFAATGAQTPQFSSTWLGWSSWVTGAILQGEIYDPVPVPGATIVSTHTPTVAQADNWVDYMDTSRLGLKDGYSVARHNCRTYSQWEFRDAPLHY